MSLTHETTGDRHYALIVMYDGTGFLGWQKQSKLDGPTIQETFDVALEEVTDEPARTFASGRTDSGVHAVGQVVQVRLARKSWDPGILQRALNAALPPKIRVRQVYAVEKDFHAQRSATRKQYSYYFLQANAEIPAVRKSVWWIKKRLDVERMRSSLTCLVGKHDFSALRASGGSPGSPVREIYELTLTRERIQFPDISDPSTELLRLRIVGSGFLKQMVRSIAGTVKQVGEGYRERDHFEQILRTRDRQIVGPTAPGRGLFLDRVWYPAPYDRIGSFGP